ncbi:M13-type metalloendopeptidase [Sandarakinorhabdus sp.]|uniref:M13 family metallopeptidase n=1 Tax=Sandarakinorhabdus sp. TaxID=1916663 RepID=UPI00286DCFBE|nr:M13-type metalloendopeptidase [Sandarakinorhabdus sp.]
MIANVWRASVLAMAIAATPVLAAEAAKPELGSFGFDVAGMNPAVKAGDDFVAFTSGKYLAGLEIPGDRSNYGMFTKLRDLSQERTRTIIEDAAKLPAAPGSNAQKVGDFYASFMDEAGIEAKGISPIKPRLDAISAAASPADIARLLGLGNREGIAAPINIGVEQDLKTPGIMAVYVGQGGLGLPDRDYYLDDKNPRFAVARTKYQSFIAEMLGLAGFDNAAARAKAVYDLEVKIATLHWTQVEQRQIDKLYNPVPRAEIAAAYPGFDWTQFMTAAGLNEQPMVIVANPSAIKGAAALMTSEPLAVWKDYAAFHTLRDAAPLLPKAFVDANFGMSSALSGQPVNQPRWKRAVDITSAVLGEAVGSLYVAKYFPPVAKAKADEMVRNIIAAMDVRLENLAWMDPRTRAAARLKLASFTPKIGYPDKWRDYSALQVVRGDALGNAGRAAEFQYRRQLDKIGKPIDKSEWGMTPMTVNAYANPLWNEIVFPAAILQAPFFDPNADPAVNYGGIGAVIGHEITHHFDDQGRKFDKDGKLSDWWTKEDETRFKALTDKVVAQYAAYEPLPGRKINGELTLGENMADLAGVNIAYDAWKRSLGGKKAKTVDGWTGDQRFLLGFSQVWRQKYRDQILNQLLTVDPHSPGHFRPYVVRNLDVWYSAFDVKAGEKFYLAPSDRLKVW